MLSMKNIKISVKSYTINIYAFPSGCHAVASQMEYTTQTPYDVNMYETEYKSHFNTSNIILLH